MPRTSSANRGRAASAVASTPVWLTSSVSLPVAGLVIKLNPRTRIAIWRAATTSGTVDMPTASVPIVRRNLSSAGLKAGTGHHRIDPLVQRDALDLPRHTLSERTKISIVCPRQRWEAIAEALIVGTKQGIDSSQARQRDMVANKHKITWTIGRIDAASGVRHDKRPRPQHEHHADGEREHLRRVAFIEVKSPLHSHNRHSR